MQLIWIFLLIRLVIVRGKLDFLPAEPYEFYFKNNPEAYRAFCSDQQVDFLKETNENEIHVGQTNSILQTHILLDWPIHSLRQTLNTPTNILALEVL